MIIWMACQAGNFCLIHAGNRSSKSFRTVASWINHKFIRGDVCVNAFWLQMTHMHFLYLWAYFCIKHDVKCEYVVCKNSGSIIQNNQRATAKHIPTYSNKQIKVLLGHQLASTYKFKFSFLFFSQLLSKSKANSTVITVYRIYVKVASKPPKTISQSQPKDSIYDMVQLFYIVFMNCSFVLFSSYQVSSRALAFR